MRQSVAQVWGVWRRAHARRQHHRQCMVALATRHRRLTLQSSWTLWTVAWRHRTSLRDWCARRANRLRREAVAVWADRVVCRKLVHVRTCTIALRLQRLPWMHKTWSITVRPASAAWLCWVQAWHWRQHVQRLLAKAVAHWFVQQASKTFDHWRALYRERFLRRFAHLTERRLNLLRVLKQLKSRVLMRRHRRFLRHRADHQRIHSLFRKVLRQWLGVWRRVCALHTLADQYDMQRRVRTRQVTLVQWLSATRVSQRYHLQIEMAMALHVRVTLRRTWATWLWRLDLARALRQVSLLFQTRAQDRRMRAVWAAWTSCVARRVAQRSALAHWIAGMERRVLRAAIWQWAVHVRVRVQGNNRLVLYRCFYAWKLLQSRRRPSGSVRAALQPTTITARHPIGVLSVVPRRSISGRRRLTPNLFMVVSSDEDNSEP
jgi:hypothetical protein